MKTESLGAGRGIDLMISAFRNPIGLAIALLAGLLLLLAQASIAPRAQSPISSEQARTLTPQERRGKNLYLRSETGSQREIGAVIGELDVPASTVTCAGCHGVRGEGKTEGGVSAGALVWSHLLKPDGHTHPSGRKHGPFNEISFMSAVAQGIDPAGNELLVAMPRYKMSAEDMADLIAYLKRIESDLDHGLSESVINVSSVIPMKGALAETGAAMNDVLVAYFSDLNSRGGIYGRKIEFRPADIGDSATSVQSARASIRVGDVFAYISGVSAGADKVLADVAREDGVPFIGPATLLPQIDTPLNRYVFYLLSGVPDQARALVNFAESRPELKTTRAIIVQGDSELASASARAADDQLRKSGSSDVAKEIYARDRFDATRLAAELKQKGVRAVFFFGFAGDESALMKAAADIGWTPNVFLLGVLATRDVVASVPQSFDGRVFLSFPTVPGDVSAAGITEYRALAEKFKIAPRHTASQLSALAAAKVFEAALKRAGKDLTREKLVEALEGLHDFDTGLTPRLTFGSNRRVGAAGAYILTIDTAKKEFVAASGWIRAY